MRRRRPGRARTACLPRARARRPLPAAVRSGAPALGDRHLARMGSWATAGGNPPEQSPVNSTAVNRRPRISWGVSTATPRRPTAPCGCGEAPEPIARGPHCIGEGHPVFHERAVCQLGQGVQNGIVGRHRTRAGGQRRERGRHLRPRRLRRQRVHGRREAPHEAAERLDGRQPAPARLRGAGRRRRLGVCFPGFAGRRPWRRGSGGGLRAAASLPPATTPACRDSSAQRATSAAAGPVPVAATAAAKSMTAARLHGRPASGRGRVQQARARGPRHRRTGPGDAPPARRAPPARARSPGRDRRSGATTATWW